MSGLALHGVSLARRLQGRRFLALDGISLEVAAGEILGIVGESGSGKSTLARVATRLLLPDAGRVTLDGAEPPLTDRALKPFRRRVQIVMQDPVAALNPRATAAGAIGQALAAHGIVPRAGRRDAIDRLMDAVGLDRALAGRRPRELSGGQRQRLLIARAMAVRPQFLVLDEPVASLDAAVRGLVLDLLLDLRRAERLGMMIISHDLALVRRIADRIAVVYLGRIIEEGPAAAVLAAPRHPYTRSLAAALPSGVPGSLRHRRPPLEGEPPSPFARPQGCAFAPRCRFARDICRESVPPLETLDGGRKVACLRHAEVAAEA